MDEQKKPRFSPAVIRAFTLSEQQVKEAVEYEKLLLFADQCNISRAAVDAKLMTSSPKQTFDWIASGEAVPLPAARADRLKIESA